jgi:hypothetical protein
MPPLASYDKKAVHPIKMEFRHGSTVHVSLEDAKILISQLGSAVFDAENERIRDTDPCPSEPATEPDTAEARRRSSGSLKLDLPHGIKNVVEGILDEGRTK